MFDELHFANSSQDHYVQNMANDIPELDGPDATGLMRTHYLPFVLSDPASVHAFMLVSASHYGRVRGSKVHAIDLLQLRGMAISEINRALRDLRPAHRSRRQNGIIRSSVRRPDDMQHPHAGTHPHGQPPRRPAGSGPRRFLGAPDTLG
jgi:hypothetical protein